MKTLREIIEEFALEDDRNTYNITRFNAAILREVEPAHFAEAMEQILTISKEIENLRSSPGDNTENQAELANVRLRYVNLLGYLSKKDPSRLLDSLGAPNPAVKYYSALALINFPNRKAVPALKRILIKTEDETLGEIFRKALEACRSRKPFILRILIGLMAFGGLVKIINLMSK